MGEFNKVLKSLRLSMGMTQDDLAKNLNISRSSVGMYEKGDREPDYETLEAIADFFNVDIDYLLGRTKKTTLVPHTIASHINNVAKIKDNKTYYLNDTTAEVAQEIFENKELRTLFDVQRNMDSEDLKALHHMALALKRKEKNDGDDTGC